MWNYCNRNNKTETNDSIYDHTMYARPTKVPFLCNGTFQYNSLNKGIPFDLIDENSILRGQGSTNCITDSDQIQFSSLRPFHTIEKGPPPCITVNSHTHNSPRQQADLNKTRLMYGHPDFASSAEEKYRL